MSIAEKIAVIAGTKTDTEMGVEFLRLHMNSPKLYSYPISENPQEQTLFQISDTTVKEEKICRIINDAKSKGVGTIFVYCNSLSGSIDFKKISFKYDIRIITPLIAYEKISCIYSRIGVIAANNQSLAGIESATLSGNENAEVIGVSLLPIVKEIENKRPEEIIFADWKIDELLDFFVNAGVQAVVLGCTHFPYFEKAITKHSKLPIINPADYMLSMLTANVVLQNVR